MNELFLCLEISVILGLEDFRSRSSYLVDFYVELRNVLVVLWVE